MSWRRNDSSSHSTNSDPRAPWALGSELPWVPVAWTWASKRFPRKGLESGVLVLLEMPSLPRTADDIRVACAPASAARRRTSAGVALGGQGTRRGRRPGSSAGKTLRSRPRGQGSKSVTGCGDHGGPPASGAGKPTLPRRRLAFIYVPG